jgi:hypothetical protein
VPDAAPKQKNAPLFVAFSRRTIWLAEYDRYVVGKLQIFLVLRQNILREQTELIIYEAIITEYCECVSVFLPYCDVPDEED